MESKVDLIKFRAPFVNTPINVIAMIEKETNKRKKVKRDVKGV